MESKDRYRGFFTGRKRCKKALAAAALRKEDMPELAEVEYYRKRWAVAEGRTVDRVDLHAEKRIFREVDTDALRKGLPGEAIKASVAKGKQMAFRFGTMHWLGIHLGMTGRLSRENADHHTEKHDHLVLTLDDGTKLVFADFRLFGRVRYHCGGAEPRWLADAPPDVLTSDFSFERMNAFLNRRKSAPIKAVLLMQECFPGIGNWMADEVLWRARIRPDVKAGAIGPKKRSQLYDTLREVCEDALRVIGTDWHRPPDAWLFNHRWDNGGICPRTGKPLRREEVGGRTTCWSPSWQVYRGR